MASMVERYCPELDNKDINNNFFQAFLEGKITNVACEKLLKKKYN
jgi:hypothetical protein